MIEKLRYLKYYSKVLLNNWTVYEDSYAQNGEDKLVELLLPNGVKSFIDIGANDGVLFSNTYKFAKNGARGVCIEPSPLAFSKLRLNQLFNTGVCCLNKAISNSNGKVLLQEDGYESTLSKIVSKQKDKSLNISCITFDNLLKKYPNFINVDLVSIDVEGHEIEVLQGLTKSNFKAKVIIIESDKDLSDTLLKFNHLRNYNVAYSNGVNTILTHKDETYNDVEMIPVGFSKL
jgi:FkbM family methyltransferase